MNAQPASVQDESVLRNAFAFDVFSWRLRLVFAIARRDPEERRQRRRLKRLRKAVPDYLIEDVGLSRDTMDAAVNRAIWIYLAGQSMPIRNPETRRK